MNPSTQSHMRAPNCTSGLCRRGVQGERRPPPFHHAAFDGMGGLRLLLSPAEILCGKA